VFLWWNYVSLIISWFQSRDLWSLRLWWRTVRNPTKMQTIYRGVKYETYRMRKWRLAVTGFRYAVEKHQYERYMWTGIGWHPACGRNRSYSRWLEKLSDFDIKENQASIHVQKWVNWIQQITKWFRKKDGIDNPEKSTWQTHCHRTILYKYDRSFHV
jgi:hypothetical protein